MQSVIVAGGNLYALALKYLGDATQWNRLALTNQAVLAPNGGVPDPMITGIVTLQIPVVNSDASGGIYAPPGPG